MAAEVEYISGPLAYTEKGPLRGEAVMWVRVGVSDKLRPVRLTSAQLTAIAFQCLRILQERGGA